MSIKQFFVMAVVLAAMAVSGCSGVAEAGYYENLANVISESTDAQQATTRDIVAAIGDAQLLPAEKLTKIEEQLDKADEYLDIAQVAAIEAAKVYEAKRAEDEAGAVIGGLRAGNAASAPLNPYAGVIEGVLGIAAAVAAAYAVKQRSNAQKSDQREVMANRKYGAMKDGVNRFQGKKAESGAELYELIGEERRAKGI